MPTFFLDTSALLKLYLREDGTERLVELVGQAGLRLSLATLGELEFRAALRARERRGDIHAEAVQAALAHFLGPFGRRALRQPLTDAVVELASVLLDRHPLRAPDAVQLASCVAVHANAGGGALYFVASDRRLLDAAAAEGIPNWDPVSGVAAPALH